MKHVSEIESELTSLMKALADFQIKPSMTALKCRRTKSADADKIASRLDKIERLNLPRRRR